MNLTTVATNLAKAVQEATGMRCYPFRPAQPNLPCAWVHPPLDVDYEAVFGGRADQVTFLLTAAWPDWVKEDSQKQAQHFLISIKDAFVSDNTLGGSCSRARLDNAYAIDIEISPNTRYSAYNIEIEVLG